jgi:adenine-specific DNA glycosylase
LVARAQDGKLWLARSEGSLFGGLWGCPLEPGSGRKAAGVLGERTGLAGKLSRAMLGSVTHVLTHRALTIDVFGLQNADGTEHASLKKLADSDLSTLGIATLTRKILASAARRVVT